MVLYLPKYLLFLTLFKFIEQKCSFPMYFSAMFCYKSKMTVEHKYLIVPDSRLILKHVLMMRMCNNNKTKNWFILSTSILLWFIATTCSQMGHNTRKCTFGQFF